jgi:hypothetical protein
MPMEVIGCLLVSVAYLYSSVKAISYREGGEESQGLIE